jgi:NAD(P)-dependent dehydrogenase (short-subunit alcohol dehydrogenase family)
MKIVVIGATGTIGTAVVRLLGSRHEVIKVSRSKGDYLADITSKESIEITLGAIGSVGAIVCAAGNVAFKPLTTLTDVDFQASFQDKLLGQVNIVRVGARHILPGGSITLTSGTLAQEPMRGSAVVSLVNAGLEGFSRAAALELESAKVRVNIVSPPWIRETLVALKMDPASGMAADEVARAYAESVEGKNTGKVIDARRLVAGRSSTKSKTSSMAGTKFG